jgi:protein gp37
MAKTKIEWTDYSWNPIVGCSEISEGCMHCYAKRICKRFGWPWEPTFHPDRLEEPLHWKRPSRIFVCSMGDLFHPDVSDGFLFSIFGIMASEEVGHHSFFVLTKRPQRMANWLNKYVEFEIDPSKLFERVWLGVSDERIPILLQIPVAKRFISCEPLLEPISLRRGIYQMGTSNGIKEYGTSLEWGIDWVICGGETGPGARPMNPDWARLLRDQCQAAGIPFFFKQISRKQPIPKDLMIREFPK